jgi:iron complex transport system permease protein
LLAVLAILLVLLGAAMAAGLAFGSSAIDLGRALSEWFSGELVSQDARILVQARLPSVLLAALVGAALATAGAVFQGLLGNPLADPYILGVSGGASLGVVVAIVLGAGSLSLAGLSPLPLAAFLGAMGAVGIIYGIAAVMPGGIRGRLATHTLLLTGVIFNAFAVALVTFLLSLASPLDAQRALFWLLGSLTPGRLSGTEMATVTLGIAASLLVVLRYAQALNLIGLGDDTAASLGVAVERTRLILFAATSLMVGAAVSAAGQIGFVGLVVPHALRLAIGSDHRLLVPSAAIGGAAFLVLADLISRALFPVTHSALPVGAVTALLGVPLFFAFLVRELRSRRQ